MGGFKRGDNAFRAREQPRGIESGLIGNRGILGAALVGKPGVLGADSGIVEASRNRMRRGNLAVFVLQNVSVSSLQHAGTCASETLMRGEASGVFTEFTAAATGFDADHFHIRVAEKIVEEANGIRAAANAGEKMREIGRASC